MVFIRGDCRVAAVALVTLILIATNEIVEGNDDINFDSEEIARLRSYSPWPMSVPPDPGNEFSGQHWAEKLGEELFSDPMLSGNQSIACASCHQQDRAFSDSLPTAKGAGAHVRNTLGLLNVGYQRWFGWDGGSDSLWSASLRPILSPIEMNADVTTVAARLRADFNFKKSLKNAGINISKQNDEALVVLATKTIGAFMRTLLSQPTSFDHFIEALLTHNSNAQRLYPRAAKRGMKLFFGEGNCHLCHFGPNFSNGEFHDTGRPFFTGVGQVDPGRYSGIQRLRRDRYNLTGEFNGTLVKHELQKTRTVKLTQENFGQWRTPGLRNLTQTAPYMHDGSLLSLRDVVDSYADLDPTRLHSQGQALLKPLNWDESDRNAVVSFLESLSEN